MGFFVHILDFSTVFTILFKISDIQNFIPHVYSKAHFQFFELCNLQDLKTSAIHKFAQTLGTLASKGLLRGVKRTGIGLLIVRSALNLRNLNLAFSYYGGSFSCSSAIICSN